MISYFKNYYIVFKKCAEILGNNSVNFVFYLSKVNLISDISRYFEKNKKNLLKFPLHFLLFFLFPSKKQICYKIAFQIFLF